MILFFAVAKRHCHHVAKIASILINRYAVLVLRVVGIEYIVRILTGAQGRGYTAEGKRYGLDIRSLRLGNAAYA